MPTTFYTFVGNVLVAIYLITNTQTCSDIYAGATLSPKVLHQDRHEANTLETHNDRRQSRPCRQPRPDTSRVSTHNPPFAL